LGPSPADEPASTSQKSNKSKPDVKNVKPKANKNAATQFNEYLQVMQPRTKKGPSWANDEEAQPQPSSIGNVHASRVSLVENAETGGKEAEKNDAINAEGISDLDWMKRRMTQNLDTSEKAFEQSDDDEMDGPMDGKVRFNTAFIYIATSSVSVDSSFFLAFSGDTRATTAITTRRLD